MLVVWEEREWFARASQVRVEYTLSHSHSLVVGSLQIMHLTSALALSIYLYMRLQHHRVAPRGPPRVGRGAGRVDRQRLVLLRVRQRRMQVLVAKPLEVDLARLDLGGVLLLEVLEVARDRHPAEHVGDDPRDDDHDAGLEHVLAVEHERRHGELVDVERHQQEDGRHLGHVVVGLRWFGVHEAEVVLAGGASE